MKNKQKNIVQKKQKERIKVDPRFRDTIDYATFNSKITNYGCICEKLDIMFNVADHRCWSAVVNPNGENIIVTFHINKHQLGEKYFDVLTQNYVYEDIYTDSIYDLIESLLNTKSYITNNE